MPNIIIDFNSFVLVLLLKRVPALSEREHISELTDPCCGGVFYRQAGWRRGCIWWCPVCRVLWMRVQQGILGSDRRRWGAAPRRSCSAEPAATAGTDACPRSGSTHTHTHIQIITTLKIIAYTHIKLRGKCISWLNQIIIVFFGDAYVILPWMSFQCAKAFWELNLSNKNQVKMSDLQSYVKPIWPEPAHVCLPYLPTECACFNIKKILRF